MNDSKVLHLGVAVALAMAVSACALSAPPPTPTTAPKPAATSAPAATTAAAPTAAPAAKPTVAPTSAPAPAPTKVTIMVGGLNKQIYLANKLTESLGHFKEENLDVSLVDEPSGVDTETEVIAGHVDLGSGSYDHTIDLQAAGKTITAVVQLLREPGEWVMLSTKKTDKIKTPMDWVGANAGVTSIGSGTHTLMRAIAVKAGIQVSDVNFVKAGAGDTFIAAMKQGAIDIGITTQPTVLRLLKTGDAQIQVDLSKPETTRAALGGDYPFISLWGRAEWIANNKPTVQRVVNAYVKTLKWIGSHSPAEITEKLPADYYAGDKDAYIQALSDSMQMFSADGRMPDGGPQFVLKTLQSFNDKVQSANIDLAKTWDPTFVETANKK